MGLTTEIAAGARSILDAATETFARAGFDSASLTDIAARAKVSKANIFHHFKSKESLYLEVMREACKGHAEFTEALCERTDLSSIDKLRQLIIFEFTDLFSHEQRSHLIMREVLNTGCLSGRKLIQPVFLRNFTAVTRLIQQGKDNGEFRSDLDPAVAAWMLGGTTMMFFQNRDTLELFPGFAGTRGPMAYAEKVYRTILLGLLAEPPKAAAQRRKPKARVPSPQSRRSKPR